MEYIGETDSVEHRVIDNKTANKAASFSHPNWDLPQHRKEELITMLCITEQTNR